MRPRQTEFTAQTCGRLCTGRNNKCIHFCMEFLYYSRNSYSQRVFYLFEFSKRKKKYIRFYGYESNVEYATIVRTQNYNLLGYVRAITEQF